MLTNAAQHCHEHSSLEGIWLFFLEPHAGWFVGFNCFLCSYFAVCYFGISRIQQQDRPGIFRCCSFRSSPVAEVITAWSRAGCHLMSAIIFYRPLWMRWVPCSVPTMCIKMRWANRAQTFLNPPGTSIAITSVLFIFGIFVTGPDLYLLSWLCVVDFVAVAVAVAVVFVLLVVVVEFIFLLIYVVQSIYNFKVLDKSRRECSDLHVLVLVLPLCCLNRSHLGRFL